MFIVSWPIICENKPQKITDKPQQGSVTTWYETTSWPFLLRKIFNFPIVSLWKSYFFYHKPTLVTRFRLFRKRNYRIDLKVGANCQNLQRCRFAPWVMVSQLQKIRIENHQSQPPSMTFWTARDTNAEEHCLWLAHFSRPQTHCQAVSDRLILSSWFNFTFPWDVIHIYSLGITIAKPKWRRKNFSIWKGWNWRFLVKKKPARCFELSRD